MKHKHYEIILAYAEGKEIQVKRNVNGEGKIQWVSEIPPRFDSWAEYRVKPEPKPDIVRYINLVAGEIFNAGVATCAYPGDFGSIKCVFDGETHTLKSAEIGK